jgi:hypothetical protein
VPDGVVGPAALAALIVETHEAMPGFRVWGDERPADACGGAWRSPGPEKGGDPPIPQAGTDVIEFGPRWPHHPPHGCPRHRLIGPPSESVPSRKCSTWAGGGGLV